MQRGAHYELAHVAAGGEPLELGHVCPGIVRSVGDRDSRERVKAPRVHPDIGIGHPHGAHRRVAQPLERLGALARRFVDQTPRARGHRLPARVADATAQRKGVIQQPDREIEVALAQRHLGPQRLGEGLDRDPALLVHQRERLVQHADGVRQLVAQQQRPAEERQRPRGLAGVRAPPRAGDGLREQIDRRLVVRPVGQRLAAHREDGGAVPVVLRERAGPGQPLSRQQAAPGLGRHISELAADHARDLAVAAGLRQRERVVQHRGALLVAAAHGMHQRLPERRLRAREQRGVADPARLPTRLSEARDPGLDRAGRHGRAPGVELTQRGRPVAHRRRALAAVLVGGPAYARVGRTAKLTAEQQLADVGLVAGGAQVARSREASHQQLVGAVVEPVQLQRPRRQRRGVVRIAGGQGFQRRIPQHGLANACDAPPLHHHPRVEVRSRSRFDPLQQLAAHERGIRVLRSQRQHIDPGVGRQPELQRVSGQRAVDSERTAQLRQCPAQRPERVRGVAEHQARKPRPRDRSLGKDQIGEHGPRLVTTRRGGDLAVPFDLRRAQQTDHESGHGMTIVIANPAAVPSSGRGLRPLHGPGRHADDALERAANAASER